MKRLLIAMLCAAPLMGAPAAYESVQPAAPVPESAAVETAVPVETVYLNSMGCCLAECTDPTHYHHCAADCAVAEHYHDCPVGCTDAAHGHGGYHHGGSRGHHRGCHD